ncbi:MAG TPA: DUF3810 domain-containing protein [Pyrinomonadaceae bacterium]
MSRIIAFLKSLKTWGRGLWVPLGVLVAGVLAQRIAALAPWMVERVYTGLVYTQLLSVFSFIGRRVSFSVGETLACFVLVTALVFLGRICVLMISRPGERARLLRTVVVSGSWSAAVTLWLFLICFGFNYQRPMLFELLDYEQRRAEAFELEALAGEIVRGVNDNYLEAHAEGAVTPVDEKVIALLEQSYDTTSDLGLLPRGDFTSPKPAIFSGPLTRFGISGFYFPFTGEPHYNAEVPDFQMPFSAAHEMAHQRGVARESEANFVAYLVCVNSGDPFIRYAGYRNGLGVISELARVEPEKAKRLAGQLGPGYLEDSRRAAIFWTKAAGAAGAFGQRINDLYLRANRVKSGVEDYRRSTALIIGHYLHKSSRDKSPAGR